MCYGESPRRAGFWHGGVDGSSRVRAPPAMSGLCSRRKPQGSRAELWLRKQRIYANGHRIPDPGKTDQFGARRYPAKSHHAPGLTAGEVNRRLALVVHGRHRLCERTASPAHGLVRLPVRLPPGAAAGERTGAGASAARVSYHRRARRGGVLWLMNNPLYGQLDAGAIWNRTFNEFVTRQ